MRYSYAWDVTAIDVYQNQLRTDGISADSHARAAILDRSRFLGRFARVRGHLSSFQAHTLSLHAVCDKENGDFRVLVRFGSDAQLAPDGTYVCVHGRFCLFDTALDTLLLDTAASRFHPASVAGLVVAAMGMFVFGLYLRSWLHERRADPTTENTEVTENDV